MYYTVQIKFCLLAILIPCVSQARFSLLATASYLDTSDIDLLILSLCNQTQSTFQQRVCRFSKHTVLPQHMYVLLCHAYPCGRMYTYRYGGVYMCIAHVYVRRDDCPGECVVVVRVACC